MRSFIFILLFALLTQVGSFSLMAESAQWYCHQVASEWNEEQIKICGVGEASKEEDARKLALENAEKEFQTLCSQNASCRPFNYKTTPQRMECRQLENKDIWKCYRLVEKTKISSPLPPSHSSVSPSSVAVATDTNGLPIVKNNILLAVGAGAQKKYTLRYQKNFKRSKRVALLFSAEYMTGKMKHYGTFSNKSYTTDYEEIAASFGVLFKLPNFIFARTDLWITTGLGQYTSHGTKTEEDFFNNQKIKSIVVEDSAIPLTFSLGANIHFYEGAFEIPLILQASKNLMIIDNTPPLDFFIGTGISF